MELIYQDPLDKHIIEGQLSTTDIVPTIYTYTIETQNVFGCVAEVSYTGRIELLPSPSFLPLAPPGSPENYEIHNYIEDNTCNVTSSAFVADGSLSIPISPTTTFNQIVTGGINNTAQIDVLRINYQPAHPTSALSLNDFIRIRIESSNGVTSNDYFEDKGNDLPLNPGVYKLIFNFYKILRLRLMQQTQLLTHLQVQMEQVIFSIQCQGTR